MQTENSTPIVRINTLKTLTFYLKKCESLFITKDVIEIHAIGKAAGMLVKLCEALQSVQGVKLMKLESMGFYDRKQFK